MVIVLAIVAVAASAILLDRYAFSNGASTSTTAIPSAGPPLLMLASCKVGSFNFPTEDGNGPDLKYAGEKITVSDNWYAKTTVAVASLVAVFYDNGTEVGSVLASANGNTESTSGASAYVNALNPAPVYLTFSQSQSWILPAGWTGSATSCDVVKLTTSPQVPQDQFGQFT